MGAFLRHVGVVVVVFAAMVMVGALLYCGLFWLVYRHWPGW